MTNLPETLPDNLNPLVVISSFLIIWGLSWLPFALIIAIKIFKWQPKQPLPPESKLPLIIPLYLIAPLLVWGVAWLTNTPVLKYGIVAIAHLLTSLCWGLGLGVLSLAFMFSVEIACGWSQWRKQQLQQIFQLAPTILLIALFIGGVEELVFRGFLQTTLELNLNHWLAAGFASGIFALLHLIWEQQETLPQLPGLWLMGMVLALARDADGGGLGLAWGLHAGWVWVIACLDTAQMIDYTGQVPEVVTGKNQKPLAGAAGFICMLLTGMGLVIFG